MENKYNLAIYPESVIDLIKSMKIDLAKEVGWFHSKNSVAHITICNFTAAEVEMDIIKEQLNQLCDSIKPVEVHLNGFGSYPNGAFYIAADENSNKLLVPIMSQFNESLHLNNMQINTDPHISIARRLSPHQLEIARKLFTKIDVTFLCDHIVLRKFDEKQKQYFVTDTFLFKKRA
jgi:2'-5' RNA ligase